MTISQRHRPILAYTRIS